MTYHPGAVRSITYPRDKFSELPRNLDEWNAKNIPSYVETWATIREMATQGHPLAGVIVKIDAAQSAKKLADAEGAEVPAWALSTLSFMDEYQSEETVNLDEALALLSQAVA
jgi:hypothetical protein